MDKVRFTRMNKEVNARLRRELRDKVLDNMRLDDVPNISIIAEYLDKYDITQLIELSKIAEVLDWQLIGRIISIVGAPYTDKEW